MPPDCAPDVGAPPLYTKAAGYSPLPGYVLIEPLGRGGFGEVWKCEAPGGLHKAIKFVVSDTFVGDDAQLRQEYEAFQQVKAIRHPFLLSLERVELLDGELVMVMELADRQLGDRFAECRKDGLPGIPREELVGYLREAAEALDVIGAKYGLQHLDVKPANLFLTAGHVQVGDYGLVSKLDAGKTGADNRGMTPRYAAPEVLAGQIHTRSDQYSLALVYFELLTGGFPFSGRNVQTLMMQHMMLPPDLTTLPEADRPAVAIALAKKPEDRFETCAAFVTALANVGRAVPAAPAARSGLIAPASTAHVCEPGTASAPTHGPGGTNETLRHDPAFTTPVPRRHPPRPTFATPHDVLTPAPVEQMAGRPAPFNTIQLDRILSAIPVAWLQGRHGTRPTRPAVQLVSAVLRAAETESGVKAELGAVNRDPDGTWGCRFLTTIDPRVAAVKLDLLWEEGGVTMDSRTAGRVVFRKLAQVPVQTGLFGFGKKPKPPDSGLEVIVELPERTGPGTTEVSVRGKFFGGPPADFLRSGEKTIVRMLDGIRRTLNNVEERRKHPRVPAAFPLTLYPLHSDGRLEKPMKSMCHDVSAGGLALFCGAKPPAKYAYVTFEDVSGLADIALLFQIIRAEWRADEVLITGRYRLDLDPEAL